MIGSILLHLKKPHSEFDLVTVLVSKQSFFQHRVWPVYQGKSYLHGIALSDFYIAHSKVSDVTKEQIYVYVISR